MTTTATTGSGPEGLRTLFVGPVPPLRGGIAQHGARLAEAFGRRGTLEVRTWRALYPGFLYKRDQRDESATPFPGAEARLSWWSPLSWRAAGRRGRAFDLVVLPWVTPFHAVACRTIARAARPTPTVAVVHNALPHEPMPMQRSLTRAGLRPMRGFVVHSGSVRSSLRELLSGRTAELVPHPPNLELAPTPLPPAEPLRLLFLGFVRAYKGLDIALDALGEMVQHGRDAHLTVAGEFWDSLEEWTGRVRDAGLVERVDLRPGYQSDETMAELLASHHVLVAPYRSATQSGVVPLAHAAGRPVVATNVGGLAEQVGDAGVVVPPEDPLGFAQAIESVGADLEGFAARARRAASSWDDVVDAALRAAGLQTS